MFKFVYSKSLIKFTSVIWLSFLNPPKRNSEINLEDLDVVMLNIAMTLIDIFVNNIRANKNHLMISSRLKL